MHVSPRIVVPLALALGAAHAYDFSALKPQGRVSDFAGVVGAAQRAEIERYCADVEKATGAEIAVVLLPTLHGEPVEDVANLLFKTWGIGKKSKDNGVLLLLAVNDRRSRLEVGYGLEGDLPDGFAGSVLRQMRPALRAGHYGDAVNEAVHLIASRIAQAKDVRLDEESRPRPSRAHPEPVPWILLLGGGAIVLALGADMRRRRRRCGPRGFSGWGGGAGAGWGAWVAADMLGRSMRGGRSGGGFGGYDSSDRFGGFGGGDSGGGGASSDW
jgi:uncharacterized protein